MPNAAAHGGLPLRHILKSQIKELMSAVASNPALRRRLTRLLIAYAIGTCVLVALLWEMRVETISSGAKVLSAFAQLTEEQTTRTIQNVEQTLEIVEERLAAAEREDATSPEEIRRELQELLASRPYLQAITVVDREGRVGYRSDGGDTTIDVSDRAYFMRQKDSHTAGFQLALPVRARTTSDWVLPATRSRQDANGIFKGVIVASVDPLFFVKVWSIDKAMPEQATALWTRDGTVLIRSPFDARTMGMTLGGGPILGQMRLGVVESTFRAVSQIDGQDRVVAYRRLAAYPNLSVSVTQSTDRVLAVWSRTAWLVAIGWAFTGAAFAWLAVKLVREVVNTHVSEDRYRVLFNESPYPMLVADKETLRFLAVNEAAVEQYGWTQAENLEMTINDHLLPGDVAAMTQRREKHGSDKRPRIMALRQPRKDGSIIDVEMAVRLIDFEGRPAYLAMAQDIGAKLSLEDLLRQSQKMEVVGQLTGGIAHDFNNILMVILGNIDVLLEEDLGREATARLDQVGEAVDRASTLTRQLLAFSRKQPLRPQLTDLNALIAETGKLLRRTLGPSIEVDSVLADNLCIVNVDRSQLETALVNLCLNARDAMPKGGKVLIESRNVILDADYVGMNPETVAGAYAMIEVSDAGTGISPEQLGKVFEPFFTTKAVGKGSGLGLSMVYGFIRQSRGHIKIYSEVGMGTSIKLYLPCVDADVDRVMIQKGGAVPRGSERILVVEDEPRVRASVVEQLRSLGYAVLEADDGDAGLALMETAAMAVDLMLTDIMMPGVLNGKALAEVVERRWPKTRIVFMSGFSELSIVQYGRLDDGVLLLSKPFRKGDLARIVREALDAPGAKSAAALPAV